MSKPGHTTTASGGEGVVPELAGITDEVLLLEVSARGLKVDVALDAASDEQLADEVRSRSLDADDLGLDRPWTGRVEIDGDWSDFARAAWALSCGRVSEAVQSLERAFGPRFSGLADKLGCA